MSRETRKQLGIWGILAIGFVLGFIVASNSWGPDGDDALAAEDADAVQKFSPVKARARGFYTPNSEALRPNEMRLIACDTGMPTARPKQAEAGRVMLAAGTGQR
jgi:ribonuclease Z